MQTVTREPISSAQHALISWKSIFAGLLVALVAHATISALGVAVGGASAASLVYKGKGGGALAGGLGFWFFISVLLSIAVGSYFAARASTFITSRVGAAQGLIIASLFFVLMMIGTTMTLGVAGNILGNVTRSVSSMDLASSTVVQNTLQKAVANTDLRADPKTVVENVAAFLINGDTEAAWDTSAFEKGVAYALSSKGLLHTAFSARTLALFNRLPRDALPSYLSGLVIGEELKAQTLAPGDVVVAMGGYNTVCELLTLHKRAVIVPRVKPGLEQCIRAERMAALGLLRVLHPQRLTPAALIDAVQTELAALAAQTTHPRLKSLDGLQHVTAAIFEQLELRLAIPVCGDRATPTATGARPQPRDGQINQSTSWNRHVSISAAPSAC